jgi:hypothetical protein
VVLGVEKVVFSGSSPSTLQLLLDCRVLLRHFYQNRFEAVHSILPAEVISLTFISTPELLKRKTDTLSSSSSSSSWITSDIDTETIRLIFVISS